MLNHAAFKGLLFLCAGEILHAVGTVRMDQLGGLQKRLPLVGCLFALGAAAIACLPPLNGFAGELVLILSLVKGTTLSGVENQLGLFTALTGLALVSGLAAATYSKAYGMTFLGRTAHRLRRFRSLAFLEGTPAADRPGAHLHSGRTCRSRPFF